MKNIWRGRAKISVGNNGRKPTALGSESVRVDILDLVPQSPDKCSYQAHAGRAPDRITMLSNYRRQPSRGLVHGYASPQCPLPNSISLSICSRRT